MPICFKVATHKANQVKQQAHKSATSPEELLAKVWDEKQQWACAELLQSSFSENRFPNVVHAEGNGFVETAIAAYNGHHHLVLRPDDVWIAILGQFNFYVNAHVKELRAQFVRHKKKKRIEVTARGSRYTVDFGALSKDMVEAIHKNVVDNELKDWILPDFSTTTDHDTVISAVLMMSTMKGYFNYSMSLMCGIPSVTLEGEKADWDKLVKRLDKLSSFGPEPTAWVQLLRPIFNRFAQAFNGDPDVDFWSRICHHQSFGSGPVYLSGWITAFCVWSATGEWQGPPLAFFQQSPASETPHRVPSEYPQGSRLFLDGVLYPVLDYYNHVTLGFCDVDVKLDDNGKKIDCMMVAGHVACLVGDKDSDTIRPLPSWFMFIKKEKSQEPNLKAKRAWKKFCSCF
ncbi:hypothetical protein BDZ94DRAFT_1282297 [Collybia nuda]|uniref:Uncharacterized protein n=1 Tax=Collybia nuda TaxID=64659 RepID=A0A9P5Y818_9AGAR|nr:hypothetical protein BDZ94DRAFT_1282297 [Collybia nuda]